MNNILFSKLLRYPKDKTAVFVLGCQRSGTTMLLNLIEQTGDVSIYRESNEKAMQGYRLRDDNSIKNIISRDKNKFVVFKPVNDIQNTGKLLLLHDNIKAIWIYRDYYSVVNSAVIKWQDAQKNILLWIKDNYGSLNLSCNNMKNEYAAYIENMRQETFDEIKEFINTDMSQEEGAALLWYIRNKLYFDLALQNEDQVLLVNYKDLVTDPENNLKRVYDFIGCKFSIKYIDKIRKTSVNKNFSFSLNPQVENICKQLLSRLDDMYRLGSVR